MIACIERCEGVIWRHGDRLRRMSRYLLESTKTGDFNPRRTLSVSFFVIPERLASIRSVVYSPTHTPYPHPHTHTQGKQYSSLKLKIGLAVQIACSHPMHTPHGNASLQQLGHSSSTG